MRIDGEPTVATPIDELARRSVSSSRTRSASCSSGQSSARWRSGRGTATEAVDLHVGRALEAVGLTEERTTNPYDLDLSRRKLVALAWVLAMDPAVLVIDEPTTGQDPEGVARAGRLGMPGGGRATVSRHPRHRFAATTSGGSSSCARQSDPRGPPAEVFDDANEALLATTGLTFPGAV